MNEKIRLDKFISNQTGVSRSETKKLIKKGFAAVNGTAVKNAEFSVDPENDTVVFCGDTLSYKKYIYIMMNKPADVVSASRSPEERTVVDLVPDSMKRRGLFPAGRLDKDSEGLLLMTNDGILIDRLMRGANHHEKEYIVKVKQDITGDFIHKMEEGVYLQELAQKTRPCKLEQIGKKTFRIILTQGLNRQIRRMCESFHYDVVSLKRVRIANITIGRLRPGEYRIIKDHELEKLYDIANGAGRI